MVIELTENNYKDIIKNGSVIVKFGALWCGPCRQLAPIFESASESIEGITFAEVSVDESPNLSKELGIRAVPTMILYKDGKEIERKMGGGKVNLDELIEKVN